MRNWMMVARPCRLTSSTIVALLSPWLLATLTYGEEIKAQDFYQAKASQFWTVYGLKYPQGADRNDVCFARRDWDDGSAIEFIKDLKDGDIYFWFRNYGWNYKYDENNPVQEVRANLYRSDKSLVGGSNWTVRVLTKNTIIIPGFPDTFTKFLGQGDVLQIIPPGNIDNVTIGFDGAIRTILSRMRECVRKYPLSKETDPFTGKGIDEIPSLELPQIGPIPFSEKNTGVSREAPPDLSKAAHRNKFTETDERRVSAIGLAQKLEMPTFKMPSDQDGVTNDYLKFIGVWSSDQGWGNGKGRHTMLVITDARSDGKISGFYIWGPPTKDSWTKISAGYRAFEDSVVGDKFVIKVEPVITAKFERGNRLALTVSKDDRSSEHSTLQLKPVWTFVRR